MATSEVNVSVVALVIALVALLVTAFQLIAQIFATAEGTRRCSRSVIGHWSTLTTWKWHWSETRFETIFASPELCLGDPLELRSNTTILSAYEDDKGVKQRRADAEKSGVTGRNLLGIDDNALVPFKNDQIDGWISLISALHDVAAKYQFRRFRGDIAAENTSWPSIRLRKRSWDAMPSEVVSPIGQTYLGDIAVMACRLGMTWKTFEPERGVLTAEGCGHSLSSIEYKTLGLTMRYLKRDSGLPISIWTGIRVPLQSAAIFSSPHHIWSREADMLMFGINPGEKELALPDFKVNTEEDVQWLMNDVLRLRNYHGANDWSQFFPAKTWFGRYEINELQALICPILRQYGTESYLIHAPKYSASIFTFQTSLLCLRHLLADRLALQPSDHLQKVSDMCDDLHAINKAASSEPELVDLYHTYHDFTTTYFKNFNRKYQDFFWILLRAHFSKSPTCSLEAREKVRDRREKPRNDQFNASQGHSWRSEQVTLQWDNIPHYVAFMQDAQKTFHFYENELEEAWITLYFRGICWARCHQMDHQVDRREFLPAQWYGSQLPIFLL